MLGSRFEKATFNACHSRRGMPIIASKSVKGVMIFLAMRCISWRAKLPIYPYLHNRLNRILLEERQVVSMLAEHWKLRLKNGTIKCLLSLNSSGIPTVLLLCLTPRTNCPDRTRCMT